MIPMPAGDYVGQMEAERGAATAELEGALAEVFPDGTPDNLEVKTVEGDADEGLALGGGGCRPLVVGSPGAGDRLRAPRP